MKDAGAQDFSGYNPESDVYDILYATTSVDVAKGLENVVRHIEWLEVENTRLQNEVAWLREQLYGMAARGEDE